MLDFGNATDAQRSIWRDQPDTRGTRDILASCLITLSLCLWSALHMNVPDEREGWWLQTARKAKWLLIGLLAPEMVAFNAYHQCTRAIEVQAMVERAWPFETVPPGFHPLDVEAYLADVDLSDLLNDDAGNDAAVSVDRRSDSTNVNAGNESAVSEHRRSGATNANAGNDSAVPEHRDLGAMSSHAGSNLASSEHRQSISINTHARDESAMSEHRRIGSMTCDNDKEAAQGGRFAFARLWRALCGPKRVRNAHESWSVVQSYLAIMGGFAIKVIDNDGTKLLPDGRSHLIVKPESLSYIFDLVPEAKRSITRSDIQDKSKADGLAKTLIILQGTWFCIQCVVRMAQQLSISLLELNTFGHAICAFIIYVLWWNKPQDIQEPICLSGPHMRELGALAHLITSWYARTMGTYEGEKVCRLTYEPAAGDSNPRGQLLQGPCEYSHDEVPGTVSQAHEQNIPTTAAKISRAAAKPHGRTRLYDNQTLYGFQMLPTSEKKDSANMASRCGILNMRRPYVDLSNNDIHCFQLASMALRRYPKIYIEGLQIAQKRAVNMPTLESGSRLYPLLRLAGFLYGGLHLLAWNAAFSSTALLYTWRTASLLVMSSGAIFSWMRLSEIAPTIWLSPQEFLDTADSEDESSADGWPNRMKSVLRQALEYSVLEMLANVVWGIGAPCLPFLYFSSKILIVAYVLGRGYLVVESFINLAHLPDSAFRQPEWAKYVPHIS